MIQHPFEVVECGQGSAQGLLRSRALGKQGVLRFSSKRSWDRRNASCLHGMKSNTDVWARIRDFFLLGDLQRNPWPVESTKIDLLEKTGLRKSQVKGVLSGSSEDLWLCHLHVPAAWSLPSEFGPKTQTTLGGKRPPFVLSRPRYTLLCKDESVNVPNQRKRGVGSHMVSRDH